MHVFYTPDIASNLELPEEEAGHCLRVLRLSIGDEIMLTDGKGCFYKAVISAASGKRCQVKVTETIPQEKGWNGWLHIAMAPTKNMDRTEWFTEKATEIGFDELSFLNCRYSERKVIKKERIEKILVSAVKQSLKATMPVLNEMTDFNKFVSRDFKGQKFIAHCYEGEKPLLKDILRSGEDALVMIGPEGDFSEEEVAKAIAAGFQPVSLGKSRLRTETAALVACHTLNLLNQNKNMRKGIWGFALVAIVLLMASCSSESEYANAIPKDAAMVMSFDFKTMAEKSGINGKGGEKVVAKLTDALKSGLEGEAYKTAEKIIQNPSESGLSFTDKVYMFITPHSNAFALLAKVDDEGKVEALLEALKNEQICTELKSESGCTWTQMGTALCAFNKGTFLLMGSNKGDALSLKGSLLSLMRQDAENSYVKTTDFGKLASAKGEVVAVMNMSFIPNDITMQMRMGMPADLKLEDIKYLVSATFEKGKIVVDVETLIENKDLIAMYEKQSAASSCIKGACLEYFPANTLVWAGGNINGKGIYDLLCENPTIRQALDNPMLPIDIEGIFSSIHGDVAVGYNSLSNNDLLIYADVTNKDFLQSFEDLKPLLAMTGGQMQLNSTGKDQYEFRMYRQSIWFGVKDNLLYISNNERLADEAGRRYGVSLQNTPWAGQVTKNRFFMAFNAAQLVKDVQENPRLSRMLGSDAAMFNAILGPCDYMDVMAPDWKSAQMNIVMKDKEVNVLQLIVRGLENL